LGPPPFSLGSSAEGSKHPAGLHAPSAACRWHSRTSPLLNFSSSATSSVPVALVSPRRSAASSGPLDDGSVSTSIEVKPFSSSSEEKKRFTAP